MFKALTGKIFSSIVSLSMLITGSIKGNDASFNEMFINMNNDNIVINSNLENAFENDFINIFKSGKNISIWFEVTVKTKESIIHSRKFRHSVRFDPLDNNFRVFLEEQDIETFTESYPDLINWISNIDYDFNYHSKEKNMEIEIQAYMKKIQLPSAKKDFDLMILWNFKRPIIKRKIRITK